MHVLRILRELFLLLYRVGFHPNGKVIDTSLDLPRELQGLAV
jgi:hypothetical protein